MIPARLIPASYQESPAQGCQNRLIHSKEPRRLATGTTLNPGLRRGSPVWCRSISPLAPRRRRFATLPRSCLRVHDSRVKLRRNPSGGLRPPHDSSSLCWLRLLISLDTGTALLPQLRAGAGNYGSVSGGDRGMAGISGGGTRVSIGTGISHLPCPTRFPW